MKVLIADDQAVTLATLTLLLSKWGYEPIGVNTGDAAWDTLQRSDSPSLALLDCQLPGRTGENICELARTHLPRKPLHIILMTAARLKTQDRENGFAAGADDYLPNPFDPSELRARLKVGERLVTLQTELRRRVAELETTLHEVKQLQGLLPICMDCKRIRDDHDAWHQVEHYIAARTTAAFTHSLCPKCFRKRIDELDLAS